MARESPAPCSPRRQRGPGRMWVQQPGGVGWHLPMASEGTGAPDGHQEKTQLGRAVQAAHPAAPLRLLLPWLPPHSAGERPDPARLRLEW